MIRDSLRSDSPVPFLESVLDYWTQLILWEDRRTEIKAMKILSSGGTHYFPGIGPAFPQIVFSFFFFIFQSCVHTEALRSLSFIIITHAFPGDSVVKNPPNNARDMGSIPGSGRSPGEGNDNPLQYSCQGNLMDRGAWQATVHRIAKELDMT